MKLASVRIVTQDVPKLVAFYEKVLGISSIKDKNFSEDFAELKSESTTLAICSQRSVEMFNAKAAVASSNRSAILEFEVSNVDNERARLNGIVTNWVLEPTDLPWHNRSMLFRDLDGNLINFYAPIADKN